MGLLDEAIRQHLELKRQHGASDEELQLQEQEALGPVRREPAAVAPEEPDASPDEPGEPAYDEAEPADAVDLADYEDAPEEVAFEGATEPADEELHEPIDSYEDSAVVDAEAGTELLEPDDAPGLEHDPEPEDGQEPEGSQVPEHSLEPEPVAEPEDGGATPTRGFEAVRDSAPEADAAEEGEGAEDDVLEETPEFLQETPEHDRLWFEQKPPRDFDFDE